MNELADIRCHNTVISMHACLLVNSLVHDTAQFPSTTQAVDIFHPCESDPRHIGLIQPVYFQNGHPFADRLLVGQNSLCT